MAQTIGTLADRGTVVILDEFQYFARKRVSDFISHLQEVIAGGYPKLPLPKADP